MPKADRPYVRVYHDDLRRDYEATYRDPVALGTWVQLLIRAEKMWPERADLPRGLNRRAMAILKTPSKKTGAALVVVMADLTYDIRGLNAERERRHGHGTAGAMARWDANADANAHANGGANGSPNAMRTESERNASAMPRRDETRRDEIPPPPTEWGRRKDRTNPRQTGDNPRANGSNPRTAGTSPRQEREAHKTGPTLIGDVMAEAQRRAER